MMHGIVEPDHDFFDEFTESITQSLMRKRWRHEPHRPIEIDDLRRRTFATKPQERGIPLPVDAMKLDALVAFGLNSFDGGCCHALITPGLALARAHDGSRKYVTHLQTPQLPPAEDHGDFVIGSVHCRDLIRGGLATSCGLGVNLDLAQRKIHDPVDRDPGSSVHPPFASSILGIGRVSHFDQHCQIGRAGRNRTVPCMRASGYCDIGLGTRKAAQNDRFLLVNHPVAGR